MATQLKTVEGADHASDEFSLIKQLFLPLTGGRAEAAGLMDDAAFVKSRVGEEQVITTDQMIVGRHAMADEPYDQLAQKSLRRALSDLAGKGADPDVYFLSVAWPEDVKYDDIRLFANGLLADQTAYNIRLAGGDTAKTPGPLSVTITAIGWAPEGRAIRRAGAQSTDVVMVTGNVGDATAGLRALQGTLPDNMSDDDKHKLIERYYKPNPRLNLIGAIRGKATASVDVSDGLVADLGHVAAASNLQIEIDLDRVPISDMVKNWIELADDPLSALVSVLTGGDDYEIAFTAPAAHAATIALEAQKQGVDVTPIGVVRPGQGVVVRLHGAELDIPTTGFQHF